MAKYSINATVVGAKHIGVIEANSKEEAEKKAWEHKNCYVSLCHQCCRNCEDAEIDKIYVDEVEETE